MDETMRKLAFALRLGLANALLLLNVLAMTKILFGLDTVKIVVAILLCQSFIGLVWGGRQRAQRERQQYQADRFGEPGRDRREHLSVVFDQEPQSHRDVAR